MELILDDEDNIQFYPMLIDLEESILSVIKSITGTLQNVQTVQVIAKCLFYRCQITLNRFLHSSDDVTSWADIGIAFIYVFINAA